VLLHRDPISRRINRANWTTVPTELAGRPLPPCGLFSKGWYRKRFGRAKLDRPFRVDRPGENLSSGPWPGDDSQLSAPGLPWYAFGHHPVERDAFAGAHGSGCPTANDSNRPSSMSPPSDRRSAHWGVMSRRAVISRLAAPTLRIEKKRQAIKKNSPRRPRSTGEPYCASPQRHEQVHVRRSRLAVERFRKDKTRARQDGRPVATDGGEAACRFAPRISARVSVYSPGRVSITRAETISAPLAIQAKSLPCRSHMPSSTAHTPAAHSPFQGIASIPVPATAATTFSTVSASKGATTVILLSSRSNESLPASPTIGATALRSTSISSPQPIPLCERTLFHVVSAASSPNKFSLLFAFPSDSPSAIGCKRVRAMERPFMNPSNSRPPPRATSGQPTGRTSRRKYHRTEMIPPSILITSGTPR